VQFLTPRRDVGLAESGFALPIHAYGKSLTGLNDDWVYELYNDLGTVALWLDPELELEPGKVEWFGI
jgi:hypothetical protein